MDEHPEEEPPLPSPPPGLAHGPAYRRRAPPTQQTSRAGLLTVAGGALVLISVFLPWVTAEIPGGSASISGFRGGAFGLLILGGFAIARGLSMSRIGGMAFRMGSPLIGGILMLILLAIRWNEIHDEIQQTKALYPTVTASIGIGFWGATLGAALVLAGGVMTLQSRR